MSDTYTKLQYHLVFSTKNRGALIHPPLRDELYAYLGGILRGQGGILLVAGGMPDHVHLLAGIRPDMAIAKMLQLLKTNSSKWMNERTGWFAWQVGYGAFSVSESKVPEVRAYIMGQEEHHRTISSEEEFRTLLRRHGLSIDD
ncbi:MAG: REP-associated tyrosine transposase [Acidobacteriota bacterium]|jgi:REP element-mobilizing transposase RayT|nr:REP-associated tyrosine transposase [Acidobacteriota bacterium]